ncbi:MAG: hypothetical protein PHH11_11920 [Methylomonas sp.]|nr:hypothetical protein [Methylomonas sp.]
MKSKQSGGVRLLVGRALTARMPPSSLYGRIYDVLSGEQSCPAVTPLPFAEVMQRLHERLDKATQPTIPTLISGNAEPLSGSRVIGHGFGWRSLSASRKIAAKTICNPGVIP